MDGNGGDFLVAAVEVVDLGSDAGLFGERLRVSLALSCHSEGNAVTSTAERRRPGPPRRSAHRGGACGDEPGTARPGGTGLAALGRCTIPPGRATPEPPPSLPDPTPAR